MEDITIEREQLAWKFADKLINQYPDLIGNMDDYEKCKAHDLNSYASHLEGSILNPD